MFSQLPSRHSPFRTLLAVIGAAALLLVVASAAVASPSRAAYRAQRLCSSPRRGTAGCLDMRLVSKSLTSADLRASAVKQAQEVSSGATPAIVNKTVPGGLTPQNLHAAYSLPTETPASPTQTIALVDAYNDPTAEADLGVYDKTFGLPACTTANGCFRKLNQSGHTSPLPVKSGEWSTEISLDVQMAHAICQNCHILLVEANNQNWGSLGAAVNAAVAAGATEVSNSYGGPEFSEYSSLSTPYYDHPGVVVTVSSGDCGYFNQGCSGWTAAANFPADAPDVVAVGGTSLTGSGSSWASSAWDDGGSGCSNVFTAQLWQSAASNFSATGCGSGRSVADVSAVGDPNTGVDVYDGTPAGNGDSTGWGVWGGTSASSPIVAGEFGLAGGARKVEFPASTLYSHSGESGALYDVSSGSNGTCSGASACKAASGYDGPTGVGSPLGLGAFVPAGSPVNSSIPSISGVVEEGQTLTANAGEWTNSPTATTYQWEICAASGATCSMVSGATAQTFKLPSSSLKLPVRVVVTAANGSGAGTTTASSETAAVASDVPTITGISPSSGPTGSTVTITGTALVGATHVKFGSLAATFTVLSSTQIEATVPNGVTTATVSVTTAVKTATSSVKFTPTLSIASETPGRAAPGATVTLKGFGFNSGSTVSFAGTTAASVTYVSLTTLRAVVPAGAKTGLITVINSSTPVGSTSTASTFTFA
jgi:subtilase family serine protease